MKMKSFFLQSILVLTAAFTLNNGAAAADDDGGYAGAFLRMGLGAEAMAMGGAYTAIPAGAYALYYNPAGLPLMSHREVRLSYDFLSLDRRFSFIGYAQALHPKVSDEEKGKLDGGFALGWINAGVDNIDGRDLDGKSIGTLSNSENAFYFAFALRPHRIVSLGLSAKVLYNRIPGVTSENGAISATGFGLDFGVMISPFPQLNAAVVLKDLKSKYTWNTEKLWERATTTVDRFPQVVRGGLAYRLPMEWLTVSADLETSDKQDPRYHVGIEALKNGRVAGRLGLDNGEPTFGIGFTLGIWGKTTSIDYAYVSESDGPRADHVFSWTFHF